MKYFHLNFGDAGEAMRLVWAKQEQAGTPRSSFHISAEGMDASVWTEDSVGEALFRETLIADGVIFEEGNEQQVRTFLDRYGF